MPEQTTLSERASAVEEEARKQEETQRRWQAEADAFHHEIRESVARVQRKTIAYDFGVEIGSIANWLACEQGRGFPPPRLILYLLVKDHVFARALSARAGYLPPERPHLVSDDEYRRRVANALALSPDLERVILDRAFGPGVRP